MIASWLTVILIEDIAFMDNQHSEQDQSASTLNHLLSEKSQREWLEHIAGWLEYQKVCGAAEWRVDDMSTYASALNNRNIEQLRKNRTSEPSKQIKRKTVQSLLKKEKKDPSTTDSLEINSPLQLQKKEHQNRVSPKEREDLQAQKLRGKWSAVSHRIHKGVEKRDSFSYLQVSSGPEGMQQIRAHHSAKGCPNCLLGRGALNASVVLIEWHSEAMNVDAFGMLKNMRERVLNLDKEQLFWLPFPRGEDCGSCTQLFRAQLGVLAPKAVLLMGSMPISHLDFVSNVPEIGEQVFLNHKGKEIPLVRTENPMTILNIEDGAQRNEMKLTVLRHLRRFHSILADLRIVKRLR